MKGKNSDERPSFIPYDDEKLEHAEAGPDYGQPWSSSNAWVELSSKEYPDFVANLREKMLKHRVRIESRH